MKFPFNSICFSCLRGVVAFGGFGTFNGKVLTYNWVTREKLAEGNLQFSSEWSWSPCGRLLLSSVLIGKLKVGNEFRIFNHFLQNLITIKVEELCQCEWVGIESPIDLPKIKAPAKEAPVAAYVPPHLRGAPEQKYPPGYRPKKT